MMLALGGLARRAGRYCLLGTSSCPVARSLQSRQFRLNSCHRQEKETVVVVESQQVTSDPVQSIGGTPEVAGVYEVIPETRNRALRKDIEQFLATYHLRPLWNSVQMTCSLCSRPALRDADRTAVTKRALQYIAEQEDVVFDLMRELAQVQQILLCGQMDAPKELHAFTLRMIRTLAKTDTHEVNTNDVITLLRVISYNDIISPEMMLALASLEDVVERDIRNIKTATVLLRLLKVVGHRESVDAGIAFPKLHKSMTARLAEVTGRQLPPKHESAVRIVLEGAETIQKNGVRSETLMDSYCRLLCQVARCDGVRRVAEASHCAYMLSYFGFRNDQAMKLLRKSVDNRRRTELQASSLSVYVRINWAMQAQGIEPPVSSMTTMTSFLERHAYRYDASIARELQLLMPLIERSKTPLRELMLAHAGDDEGLSRVVSALQAAQASVLCNIWLDCGVVPVVALVSEDGDSVLPWPANIPPGDVSTDNIRRLPGLPVALFLVEGQHLLVEPKGHWSGVVEKQRRILSDKGWRVSILSLFQVSQSTSVADDCCNALFAAIKPSLR